MNRFFYAFLFALLFASCDKEDITIKEPELGSELVDVTFNVVKDKTRIWYGDPVGNDYKFYPTWNSGDSVAVIDGSNRVNKFTATNDNGKTTLSGKVKTWEEGKTIYTIYPHRSDAYSFNNGVFTVNMSSQTINTAMPTTDSHKSNTNSMNNSVLLANLYNVGFTNNKLTIDDIYYRQAMSFLRFKLKRTDNEHKITKVTLKDPGKELITQAKVKLDGEEIKYDKKIKANEVYGIVEKQDVTGEAIINFALFPTTLTSPTLEITTTDKYGNYYKFTKDLPANLKFIRNEFRFYSDPLDLENDFTVEKSEILDLDNLPSTLPGGNNFVVKSKDVLNKDDTTPLKTLVESSSRKVNLTFPNVTKLDLQSVFESWIWLKSIELPICKEIGTATFVNCPILTKVVMPALEISGGATFDVRDKQPDVEFIAATNPGIKLNYAYNGVDYSPADGETHPYDGYRIEKVNLILGNEHLYDPNGMFRIEDNNFLYGYGSEIKAIYFKSITWQ